MVCRVRMLMWVCAAVAVLGMAGSAWSAERPGERPAPPAAPINVNVTVNVTVSHDTNIDVRIDAPLTPVIGSVQIPDFVQNLVAGFLKPSAPAATGSKPLSSLIPTLPKVDTTKPAVKPEKK